MEQLERVGRIDVLADHQEARVRVLRAQQLGQPEPLLATGGRHADVGDHDVHGPLPDHLPQRFTVRHGGNQLDLVVAVEDPLDPFAYEEVVVRQCHPNGHARDCRFGHSRPSETGSPRDSYFI